MHASADRLDFAPPPQPGMVRAFALAVIAHILLMLALTWGITWNRHTEQVSAEAELWSSVPQEAAPQAAPPLPPVVQAPPVQAPPPPPPPVEKAEPPPAPPAPKAPDIALEREKKKQELVKQREEELERQKKIEAKRKQEELKREQLAAAKKEAEARKKEEQAKADKAKKQQAEEDKKLAASRAAQMERIQRQAAATGTGGPTATGTAPRSAGPSASYAGRIVARVRPNIVFTDDIAGNPIAEVEVRTSPDGTIVGRRIVKSSGVDSWDKAVLRALDKTEVLPRDVDGRVPSPMILEFRPRS